MCFQDEWKEEGRGWGLAEVDTCSSLDQKKALG